MEVIDLVSDEDEEPSSLQAASDVPYSRYRISPGRKRPRPSSDHNPFNTGGRQPKTAASSVSFVPQMPMRHGMDAPYNQHSSADTLEGALDSALATRDRHRVAVAHTVPMSKTVGGVRSCGSHAKSHKGSSRGVDSFGSMSTRELKDELIDEVLAWRQALVHRPRNADGLTNPATTSAPDQPHPIAFPTATAYFDHFRPLLLLELQGELLKGYEEHHGALLNAEPVGSSQPVKLRLDREVGWAIWEMELKSSVPLNISEMDVLFMTHESPAHHEGKREKPQPARKVEDKEWLKALHPHLPTIGVVTWRERTDGGRHFKLQLALPVDAFVISHAFHATGAHSTSHRSLQLCKIGQLTTAHREWLVLHKLVPNSEGAGVLRPELLRDLLAAAPLSNCAHTSAESRDSQQREWERQQKWQRLVKSVSLAQKMDEGQQRVLRSTSDMVYHGRCGFALVQGPPGTGKTTFLRGLLNVLHNAATQEYYDRVLNVLSTSAALSIMSPTMPGSTDDGTLLGSITGSMTRTLAAGGTRGLVRRGRILVCAQSNAALDELIARVLRLQFVDEFGCRYRADLVRLGSQPGEVARDVSLAVRVQALINTVTGADKGTPRSPAEQQIRRTQLATQRASHQREQAELAKRREQGRGRLKQLAIAREAALACKDELASKRLASNCATLNGEQAQLAQRLVVEQLKVDEIDAEVRVMDLVGSSLCRPKAHNDTVAAAAVQMNGEARRLIEHEVIKSAHIVFCTLSGAGEALRLAEVSGGFETAIFDEAAQASELSTLIPLQHGVKRVVLVGDPQQLPATVISVEARRRGYDTSLFERLQRGGHPCHLLSTQYRMHPSIRRFPSVHFYGRALHDGDCVTHATRTPVGAPDGGAPGFLAAPSGHAEFRLAPYIFFNLVDGEQRRSKGSRSLHNQLEARFCVRLLLGLIHGNDKWRIRIAEAAARRQDATLLVTADGRATPPVCKRDSDACIGSGCCKGAEVSCALGGLCGRVSILTPYKEQCRVLEHELTSTFGSRKAWTHAIEVASVDTFQGRESDVILFSCVRSGRGGLGFVKDLRRLNVALTRARHALYIVGNERSLQQSSDWKALITDARERSCIQNVQLSDLEHHTPGATLRAIPLTLLDGSPANGCATLADTGSDPIKLPQVASTPAPARTSIFLYRHAPSH